MRIHRGHLSIAPVLTLVGALLLIVPASPVTASHGAFPVSSGIYRIPYQDGTNLTIGGDHHDHDPVNRIDMNAGVGTPVVAAASGTIRAIVDFNGEFPGAGDGVDKFGNPQDDSLEHSCQDDEDPMGNSIPNSVVVGLCQEYNNYVWIEHPNGEWTKYTHFGTGTVTANLWVVGQWIEVGEVLGLEGDVGRAGGSHLHHEVGVPFDPTDLTPFSTLGGFMPPTFGINVVPLVCDIPNNLYATGDDYTANPCDHEPPTAEAGGPYVVDEGSTVQLDGSGSTDGDGDVLPLTYVWAPATFLDDASLAQPTYAAVDDVVNDPLMLTVYDAVEALSDSDSTSVTVLNVPPDVTAVGDSIDEGETATVSATFTDPGILDTHTASIDWDDGSPPQAVGIDELAAGVEHVYGDDATFHVEVTVTDDDGGVGQDIADVVVANVDPDVQLGSVLYLAHAGDPLDVDATTTDPGSDDLTATWTWGDGQTEDDVSLVNPPFADPPKSPTLQPRDIQWTAQHVYADACLYELVLDVVDDDGGSGSDTAAVVITGNDDTVWGSGWWMNQYRPKPPNDFSTAELVCYLDIVREMSAVFDEARGPLMTRSHAVDILFVNKNKGTATQLFDEQLLAVWLNFANGGYDLDSQVDTTGDGVADVSFANAVAQAEAVRLNPGSTRAEILAQKDILELIVTQPVG